LRDRDFYLEVAYALTSCQLIEQELKLYISEAFQLAAKCVGHRMVFKFSGDEKRALSGFAGTEAGRLKSVWWIVTKLQEG
jgi:hypothetical protein